MSRKIKKQIVCEWVDESVSDSSIEFLSQYNFDREKFLDSFSRRIGRYRSFKNFTNSAPMPKETIRHLEKMRRQITNLIESIDLIPSDAHAWNTEAVFLQMKNNPTAQILIDHNMSALLEQYSCILIYSIAKLEEYKNSKGRNKDLALHLFIYDTYISIKKCMLIPLQKSVLYELVSKFLIMNGINVPVESENIGKIIRNIKKLKNDTLKV